MYNWFVSGMALDISIAKLNRRGIFYCLVPSDYSIEMDEYFWGQWQGERLGE